MMRLTVFLWAACTAAGCLSAPEPEDVVWYDCDTKPAPWAGERVPLRLVVRDFSASESLDREGIRYLTSDIEGGYWTSRRWTAPVPALVREAVIRDLETAGIFLAVVHGENAGAADIALGAEVLRFNERDRADGWYAEVEVSFEAVRTKDAAILYHRRMATEERCDTPTVRDVVMALGRGLGRLLEALRGDLAAAAKGGGA